MKALTIKNPWAMLIAAGIKDIENRTWRTNFRGRIYIHCSQKPVKLGTTRSLYTDDQWYRIKNLAFIFGDKPNGCIIGEVDIVDCVQDHASIWAEKSLPGEKPIWNWVLAKPVLYDQPIENIKGALSLWEYKQGA